MLNMKQKVCIVGDKVVWVEIMKNINSGNKT